MNIFDMINLDTWPYEKRGKNVFYEVDEFKTRVIELESDQSIPDCKMTCHVIFYVVKGEVEITCNGEKSTLKEHQLIITEPACLSMYSANGARLMGIQIK